MCIIACFRNIFIELWIINCTQLWSIKMNNMTDNWIELNTNTLKAEKVNALAWTTGMKKDDKIIKTSIFTASKRSWSLTKNFKKYPKLITTFPTIHTEYPLSEIGNKLPSENRDSIPLKYVAVLTTVFHIKNKIEIWKDFCNNGIFDIWNPAAPYNSLNLQNHIISDFHVESEQYNSLNEKNDPMILLIRVYELDNEYSNDDILVWSKGIKGVNAHFDKIKDDVNRKVLLKNPVIQDDDFDEIRRKIIDTLDRHNARA